MAGGKRVGAYMKTFTQITCEGKLTELAAMPTAKGYFSIVDDKGRRLITVGGFSNQRRLKETQAYSLGSSTWSALPFLS